MSEVKGTGLKVGDWIPAFPNKDQMGDGPSGMTLRDYFAAKAMQGMILGCYSKNCEYQEKSIADRSYEMADQMLKAREA